MNVTQIRDAFARLVLYHQVVASPAAQAMERFLAAVDTNTGASEAYLHLVRSLYQLGPCAGPAVDAWQNHLLARILADENAMTLGAAVGRLPEEAMDAAAHDLRRLQHLFRLTAPACAELARSPHLPRWPGWDQAPTQNPAAPIVAAMAAELAAAPDWGLLAPRLAAYHREAGAGLPAMYWYLRWDDGELKGVAEPQVFDLDDLVGLEEAKGTVLRNTEQFLRGGTGNNLLLYGNRGTGKSSMVRGLPARYGAAGLRLVEVARSAMGQLPALFRALLRYRQRFILFLDDLSFQEGDASYQAFKSMVEGALEQRPANVLLYATSNRRHLVPQKWSDRNSPTEAEVHGQDAMEEKLSLGDRFGVTVIFPSPDQEQYLAIVEHMARQRGLPIERTELREAALRWVLWNNPRSGRAARQFIDDLAGRIS